ncbi:MAG: pseudouridine-5'-phosphate glycosidase [Phycisphaerales bacterium]
MDQAIVIHEEVRDALASGRGVVALETAVLTHGLPRRPWPQPPIAGWLRDPHEGLGLEAAWRDDASIHLETVRLMGEAVRGAGSVPAVVGMLGGTLHVGLDGDQLAALADAASPAKLSARDLGIASSRRADGGTTVAGTLAACSLAATSIRVMATGGIGGAHRGWNTTADVSADLRLLAESPVCLVASGAKSILDIAATAEMLDTLAVPTVGFRTSHWPRFISPPCGTIACPWQVDSPADAAAACRLHWGAFAQRSAVLMLQPPPARWALADAGELDRVIAEESAAAPRDRGPDVTPHLLQRLVDRTGGRTLLANIALLLSNARLAGEIATALAHGREPDRT